jgi:hypothetical protein
VATARDEPRRAWLAWTETRRAPIGGACTAEEAASAVHAVLAPERVRDAIRSLAREWVLAHIEPAAEPVLRRGDRDTYRRLLELCEQLDPDLRRRLAERAVVQPDPETRAAGDEFQRRIADAATST